jgi:hypothetical protein
MNDLRVLDTQLEITLRTPQKYLKQTCEPPTVGDYSDEL